MLPRKKATGAVPAQPRPRPLSQAVVVELPAPTLPREVDTAGPVTQRLATEHSSVRPCGALRAEGSVRSGGGDVRTGWLRKSPPEKKLRRCAWTKRWFILRHGQMSGDPDVLEYYKNDRSKKPLRVINLNLCEHVGDGLRFKKKKLQYDFVFSIRTSERVFYLVAKTEEDKNEWVQSIRQICDFIQAEKRTDFLRKISLAIHGPCSSPGELSRSSQHLPREPKSSAPLHSSEPTLFTFERAVSNHMKCTLSASAPQVYPYLHQCVSGKAENASYSFSSGSSQCCHPVKSFTSTDSGDEEDYVPKQSLMCASPITSDIDSSAPKKSTGSDDYVSPDFQPSSPSPHHKVPGAEPSMSLLTRMWSTFKLKKVKTQALQHTMLELAEVEQSSDPCKSAKQ